MRCSDVIDGESLQVEEFMNLAMNLTCISCWIRWVSLFARTILHRFNYLLAKDAQRHNWQLDGAKQDSEFITAHVKHPEVVYRETISVCVAFILNAIRVLEDIHVYYSTGYSGLKIYYCRGARLEKDSMQEYGKAWARREREAAWEHWQRAAQLLAPWGCHVPSRCVALCSPQAHCWLLSSLSKSHRANTQQFCTQLAQHRCRLCGQRTSFVGGAVLCGSMELPGNWHAPKSTAQDFLHQMNKNFSASFKNPLSKKTSDSPCLHPLEGDSWAYEWNSRQLTIVWYFLPS